MWQAEYKITLKEGILDPTGIAIRKSLQRLGHEAVAEVRAGKIVRVILAAADREEARQAAEKMAEELLVNPVTEDYHLSISEVS